MGGGEIVKGGLFCCARKIELAGLGRVRDEKRSKKRDGEMMHLFANKSISRSCKNAPKPTTCLIHLCPPERDDGVG